MRHNVPTPAALLFAIGAISTALATLAHGAEGDTPAAIQASATWGPIHLASIGTYAVLAAGALALAIERSGSARASFAIIAIGGLLSTVGHALDGPVRLALIDEVVAGDGSRWMPLEALALAITVPALVMLGVGGAIEAVGAAASATGRTRAVASGAVIAYVVGSGAGWGYLALGILPGVVFLGLALGWIWSGIRALRSPREARAGAVETAMPT